MLETLVQSSQCILLPSGRDYAHCVDVFEDRFHIKVPAFPDRLLSIVENGRHFVKVKSRDVPRLIRSGFADVGLAYTDVCEENLSLGDFVHYETIGPAELRLSLLLPKSHAGELETRLYSTHAKPLSIATAYPNLLERYLQTKGGKRLNVTIASFIPTGSAEAMVALGVADTVADVVNTSATAQANNLEVIPLTDIFPAVVYRK